MPLNFPEPKSVTELLQKLLGQIPPFEAAKDAPVLTTLGTSYGAICIDDKGVPIAAMFADLKAAAALGGALMMMPPAGLESQVKDGEAEDTVVEALSEVFNNLTITFNRVKDNTHMRSTPVAPAKKILTPENLAWLNGPGKRLDLTAKFGIGQGRLVLLTK